MTRTDSIALLEGLGVTLAWANEMEYAALWLPDYCVMVLDASRGGQELSDAVDDLMPSVRRRALPSRLPRSWSVAG